MGILDILQVLGLTLAFVDFFQLAGWLEKRVDRLRSALNRLLLTDDGSGVLPTMARMSNVQTLLEIKPLGLMMTIGMSGLGICFIGSWIGAGLLDPFDGSLFQEVLLYVGLISMVIFGLAVLVVLAGRSLLLLIMSLLLVLRGVLHVLDMPPAGTIGTIGLLLAIGSFVGQ